MLYCRRNVGGSADSVSRHGGCPLSLASDRSEGLPSAADRVYRDGLWPRCVVETAVRLRRLEVENGRHGVGRLIAMRMRMMMCMRVTIVALIQRLTERTVVPEARHLHNLQCPSFFKIWRRQHPTVSTHNYIIRRNSSQCKGNYSARWNNMKFVHWPSIGGLLHLVQRWRAWAGPQLYKM